MRELQLAGGQPLRPNHKGLKWLIVVGLASVLCWAPSLSPLWPPPAPTWPGQASTAALEPTRLHNSIQTEPGGKTALCSSVWLSIRPLSSSSLQIALVSCCKVSSHLLFANWSMFEVHQVSATCQGEVCCCLLSRSLSLWWEVTWKQLGLNFGMNFWKWAGLTRTGQLAF